MDTTRLTFGTIKIESKDHSLTLGLSLPFFMAEQLNGQMVPEEWEDIIAEQVFRGRDVTIWSGRFDFPGIDEQPSKGGKGRKGAGQLPSGAGLGQGKAKPAVSGTRRVWVNGRGVRELSIRRGVQALSAVKAGNMARKGYTGLSKGKDTKRVVPKKRIKALAGVAVG